MTTHLTLAAPLAGWSTPLEELPDAAFAERMLGDGIAIDPTGHELTAPCDGEVISVAAAHHAVAVRSPAGIEVLMHVGIDTVELAGAGFEVHVKKGDRIRTGDRLLTFDLDFVARRAKSLLTPVIVTNGERFRIVEARAGRSLAAGELLLALEQLDAGAASAAPAAAPVLSEAVVVRHAHGIHARPAALIARCAKAAQFELEIRARGRSANARSVVAVMALGIRGGDEVVIVGFEPGAAAAVAEIAGVIRNLDAGAPAPRGAAPTAPVATPEPAHDPALLSGVTASGGFALGSAFRLDVAEIAVRETGAGSERESAALAKARAAVRERLTRRAAAASGTARELIDAHLELLDDDALLDSARRAIVAGKSAEFAWRTSLRASAAALRATGDARLAERVDDLVDLERQVLLALRVSLDASIAIPPDAILLARELTPSQLLDAQQLAGIALAAGGPTSHVAILAAAQGIPMIVAAGERLLEVASGTPLILDADGGTLRLQPDATQVAAAQAAVGARRERQARARASAQTLGRLASGERVEVFANLSSAEVDARFAVEQGAEGCGLLRTEFLFLDRALPPDETEQLERYRKIATLLGDRPLVIRTLDIGGDKPIPYYPMPPEENPALGLRGVRATLRRPELLETQLRALIAARAHGDVRILLPMISDVEEIHLVQAMLDRLRADTPGPAIPLGAMIETPGAAMLAREIAAQVDFVSLGTNDLAQYSLAMDRGHAELAARIDGVHPAVLRLIDQAVRGVRAAGKPVAVCGGLASDPKAVPLLLGLGVTELSVVPRMIPEIKSLLGGLTLETCRRLAQRALALSSASEVRALLDEEVNT